MMRKLVLISTFLFTALSGCASESFIAYYDQCVDQFRVIGKSEAQRGGSRSEVRPTGILLEQYCSHAAQIQIRKDKEAEATEEESEY